MIGVYYLENAKHKINAIPCFNKFHLVIQHYINFKRFK